MPARTKGEIRRSQLITTYGVGAIVAVEDESFMIAGMDRWPVSASDLHEPRLERELGVHGFVVPPATEDDPDIPVVRFPTMMSCPECHRLAEHRRFTAFGGHTCNVCEWPLVPSRFVVVCDHGHIDDFPYFNWVHAGSTRTGEKTHDMRIEAAGTTASLRDIVISCSCGVQPVSMDGAFSRDALRGVFSCSGRRPWLQSENESCGLVPRTLQRGASNVWFPVVQSALSIPPWSEGALRLLNRYWIALRHVPDDGLLPVVEGMGLAKGTEYGVQDLVDAVRQRRTQEDAAPDPMSLRPQEYDALVRGRAEVSNEQDFVCVAPERLGPVTERWFSQVMLVKRLREVRALESFTRLLPPSPADPQERRSPLSAERMGWLPGIEVTGEGIFLHLREESVRTWEERPAVRERAAVLNSSYRQSFLEREKDPDRVIMSRLVLIHTLAHVLINEWSLECGYPSSSLRERLYVSPQMADLLCARRRRLGRKPRRARSPRPRRGDSTTRSCRQYPFSVVVSDPLCIEADASGVDSPNLAACHACVLLPEVSCEERDLLLDRALAGSSRSP